MEGIIPYLPYLIYILSFIVAEIVCFYLSLIKQCGLVSF